MMALFCLLFTHHALYAQKTQKKKQRPNIIFLLTDDQRYDAMGAMGNSIIQTPNMDKLAMAGILFQNAYVTTSICCVSRASILTGQYESRHHINDFNTNFTKDALSKTYPALLKKAGYIIAFIGKFGVGNHPPDSIFDYFVNTESIGGRHISQPNYIINEKNGYRIHDTDTIDHAIQIFLDKYGHQKIPFCLSVSFKAPHIQDASKGNPPKYIIQPRYKDYYKNITIPLPTTAKPKYWNAFPSFFRTDTNFARARWYPLFSNPTLYQENVKNYYRLITGVDDVIGNMMKKLKKLGIDSNTVIIFMSDNGNMLGEKEITEKWYGYESSIRVPLFIYDPYLPDKIQQTKPREIALNIDIAPTILSIAGVPIPKCMQGINLIDLVEHKIPDRKDFFYQHYFLGSPQIPRVEGVVTKRFKYMNYIEYNYEELYDIKYDPHEIDNLVKDPNYKLELDKIRRRYKELQKIYGMPQFENNPKCFNNRE